MAVLQKRQPGLTVVLENVFDPHNISAVLRTCDAVGVAEVYVLTTRMAPHKFLGAKSSSSANKWVQVHSFTDADACFAAVRARYGRIFTTQLSADAVPLYEMNLVDPVALVFGNEHSGVSEDVLPYADGNFVIPQVGIIQSLNISVACAVTLYEAFRQKSAAGHYTQQQLSQKQYQTLRKAWGLYE